MEDCDFAFTFLFLGSLPLHRSQPSASYGGLGGYLKPSSRAFGLRYCAPSALTLDTLCISEACYAVFTSIVHTEFTYQLERFTLIISLEALSKIDSFNLFSCQCRYQYKYIYYLAQLFYDLAFNHLSPFFSCVSRGFSDDVVV